MVRSINGAFGYKKALPKGSEGLSRWSVVVVSSDYGAAQKRGKRA
jgi:hypothetical protein